MATVKDILEFDGRIAKVDGPAQSGKTEALVRKCAAILAGAGAAGVGKAADAGAGVLVVCATTQAARAFEARVLGALEAAGKSADEARGLVGAFATFTTMHNACVSVLSTDAARAATGRTPRALNRFEYNFLLEDMKTLGQPIRRLKGMMAHFKSAMANMQPLDDVASVGEERFVFDHMVQLLTFEGAMLAEEVAWTCANYLQSAAGAGAAHSHACVLVDDFQNLSAAEQRCACLMAKDQLIVAGCAEESVGCVSAYPSAEGFANFDKLRHGVTTFELQGQFGNAYVKNFARAILSHDPNAKESHAAFATPCAGQEKVACIKWQTPEDEFANLTKHIRVFADKTAETPFCQTAVVVPNKRWAKAFSKMLAKRGFDVSSCDFARIGGDPRDISRARAMMAYTKLNLLANPEDGAAWRTWCGYGNFLCNSDAWDSFVKYAAEQELGLLEGLASVADNVACGNVPFLRAEALAEKYTEARAFIDKYAAATGFSALNVTGAENCTEFADIAAALVGDESAAAIFAQAEIAQRDVVFADNKRAVHLVSYAELAGLNYTYMYAPGLVDGFTPTRDAFEVVSTDEAREGVMNSQRRAFAAGVAKCQSALTLSTFATSSLELAEITKMQVVRIRSVADARVATVRPTCFIAEAEAHTPITTGGQALLGAEAAD